MIPSDAIIQQARNLGASLAGLARTADLQRSPSHGGQTNLPAEYKSILVMALVHDPSRPELDWWDGRSTPGIRKLRQISLQFVDYLKGRQVAANDVHYQVSLGGVFVKDAAVLAGLGVIGRNNLLITPQHGALVRLRATAIAAELEPTGPTDFNPCDGCPRPCWTACPRTAFESGSYSSDRCWAQMSQDIEDAAGGSSSVPVKYCRECELACPAAGKAARFTHGVGSGAGD